MHTLKHAGPKICCQIVFSKAVLFSFLIKKEIYEARLKAFDGSISQILEAIDKETKARRGKGRLFGVGLMPSFL